MRKFTVIPMAALLALAIAAPVAAGPNVTNASGSATTAQGSWFSDSAGGFTYGYMFAWQQQGETSAYIEFFESSGNYVDCTPADETDDSYGFQGTHRYGWGEGSLSVGRGYADATATGTVGIDTATVDDCAGTYVSDYEDGVAIALDLVATGAKVMERGTGSFKIPGEINNHYSYSSTYRIAAGTASIGSDDLDVEGAIGKVSWRDHFNG